MASLWSILALSATLASEARRGSLEFVATTPLGKRRIALEKLAAHLTGHGDRRPRHVPSPYVAGTFGDASLATRSRRPRPLGFALWVGLVALAAGSVAFALAPFLGRGASAAIAGAVLLGRLLRQRLPGGGPGVRAAREPDLVRLDRRPPAARRRVRLGVARARGHRRSGRAVRRSGSRRSPVATSARRQRIPWPRLPAVALGLRGPLARSFGRAAAARVRVGHRHRHDGLRVRRGRDVVHRRLQAVARHARRSSRRSFPSIDLLSGAGGFLQLAFITFGFILAGFAAATLVEGWASDETDGRLEVLLSDARCRAPAGRSAAASACTRRSSS